MKNSNPNILGIKMHVLLNLFITNILHLSSLFCKFFRFELVLNYFLLCICKRKHIGGFDNPLRTHFIIRVHSSFISVLFSTPSALSNKLWLDRIGDTIYPRAQQTMVWLWIQGHFQLSMTRPGIIQTGQWPCILVNLCYCNRMPKKW